jgi:hypothetical protein
MLRRATIFLACAFLIAARANAQTFDEKYGKMISDGAARAAIKLALEKIGTAICESNQPCAPAIPEEFERPPITVVDARAAMVFGIKSALAQWCGLDWRRSFLPMIVFGKQKMKMSDRQMQLMTLIHGDFQGRQLAFYSKSGKCPPQFRQQLDAQLPKLKR